MRRISILAVVLALILLWRWMAVNDQPAPPAPPATPTAEVSYTVVPLSYMDAASALAQDDFVKAKESLTLLAKESRGDLQARAQAAANTADIEAMRESFKSLSERAAVNMSYPDDYAVAFCPTYKGGTKWIQKRDAPIANPYLGKANPSCGSFVD
jgi:hypothetical protein